MATTTNYGWTTPDDTALVKDGASAIRSLGTSVDTTTKNLNPSTTLGDIEYRSSTANTNTRLAIGSTGDVLTVAGGVPTWAAPAAGATFVGCSVYKSGNQSASNNTYTSITFDTEFYDTNSIHNNSTNTTRFTIPSDKAGKWLLTGSVIFASNSTGLRYVKLIKNGSTLAFPAMSPAVNGDFTGLTLSFTYAFAANDYLEIQAYQTSGTTINILGGSDQTLVQFTYLGA